MSSGIRTSNSLQPGLVPIHTTFDPVVKVVYAIKGKSMLDAIFMKKSTRARVLPAYVTTTVDATTIIHSVGSSGALTRVAKIAWVSETSDPRDPWKGVIVRYNRIDYPADAFGRRSKAMLGKRQASFVVSGRSFMWQPGLGSANPSSPALDLLDTWKCVAAAEEPPGYVSNNAESSSEPVASTSAQESQPTSALHKGVSRISGMFKKEPLPTKEILVRLMPPQPAVVQGELAIDTSVANEVVSFLISAILLTARFDDWKHFQSALPPQEIEATLVADRSGSLPPYVDTPGQTERPTEGLHPTLSNNTRWRWNVQPGNPP
ncbi:hypothetical protein M408DRAFT_106710 [Serendipita vermifera MAFF 305830]|uniref:Uncharacterized protein n=1 Tax=Serendipita vermifera MAFF 305830 TaxID=933852 RepID=A0A0C3BE56_SERVB|nr:hypothetical protein M408DRAFT_106710 [Serendipita vermifera MAFF 305830]